jgi:organic radical activating enzyme
MKIDIEKRTIYNCDAASPQQIKLQWIEDNPGQLFNTPLTVAEREMMLLNQRNSSCENNCFRAEDVGAVSPRVIRKGYVRSHSETRTYPSVIDITLGSDCNLTCSYCTKEFSSAWRKDLLDNGDYPVIIDDDRYQINLKDKTLFQLSQPSKYSTKNFTLILKEVELMVPHLELVYITGGESLLQNNLFDLLDKLKDVPSIQLFSGLGLSVSRLEKILSRLQQYKNVVFKLSCENIGKYLEFNRFGINWDQYQVKLNLIKQYNIDYIFHSTLSNLSLFGYHEFVEHFKDQTKEYDFAYKPDFMSPYVMDQASKDSIIRSFEDNSIAWKKHIFKSLEATPTELQVQNLRIFLKEFTKRRNIDIKTIYPKSFIDWIDNVV